MTDEELMRKLLKKDMRAFDYIMSRYNKLLWLVVGNILEKVGTPEDVEDCISDVYLKLLENPKLFDYKKGSIKSFLVSIAKNTAIDRYRKLSRSSISNIETEIEVEYDDNEFDSIISQENSARILEAIDSLNEPDREIIIRRYYFNEKIKVVSEKMGLQPKQIENRLYQGKLKLKKILESKEG